MSRFIAEKLFFQKTIDKKTGSTNNIYQKSGRLFIRKMNRKKHNLLVDSSKTH